MSRLEIDTKDFSIGRELFKSVKWSVVSTVGRTVATLLTIIVSARFLLPTDFGAARVVLSATALFELLSQFGFAQAVIGIQKPDRRLVNTLFTVSLLLAGFLYIILYFSAPLLEKHYVVVDLTRMMRINGILLFLTLGTAIPISLLERSLNFKAQAIVQWTISLTILMVTIPMAIWGAGVWTLIIPRLFGIFVGGAIAVLQSGYIPRFAFDLSKLKQARNFGISSLVSNFTNYVSNNALVLVMGSVWTSEMIGVYSFASSNYSKPLDIISMQFNSALFPILSKVSSEISRVKKVFLKLIRVGFFLILPLYIFLLIGAEFLIPKIFGHHWDISITAFQIFCFYAGFKIFTLPVSNTLYALNMPHVTAKIAVFRMVAYLMVVAYCLWNQIGMHHTLWLILIPETISNFAYHFAALWRVGGKLEDLKDFFVGPIFLNLIFGAILFGGITLIDYLGFANYQSFLGLGLITFVGYGFIVLPKIQEDVRKIRIL